MKYYLLLSYYLVLYRLTFCYSVATFPPVNYWKYLKILLIKKKKLLFITFDSSGPDLDTASRNKNCYTNLRIFGIKILTLNTACSSYIISSGLIHQSQTT